MDIHGTVSVLIEGLKPVLAPSVVAAAVSVVFGSWFNHRAEQNLERSKSLLRAAEEQTKTRFSWLYVNRAKVMMEIYRLAIKVDESFGKLILTLDLEPSSESSMLIMKRVDNTRASISAFHDYYQPRRLIFSGNISEVLDKLSERYATVPRTFDDNIDPDVWETDVYGAVAAVAKRLPDTSDLIGTLESEFRNLYGSLDSPMPRELTTLDSQPRSA